MPSATQASQDLSIATGNDNVIIVETLGRWVDYPLDADNYIVTATRTGSDGERVEVTSLAYDDAGRVISQTVDNGDTDLVATYQRDPARPGHRRNS